jgi:hypothetical protein
MAAHLVCGLRNERCIVKALLVSLRLTVAGVCAVSFAAAGARADEACGLCSQSIVTNSSLADCFLEQYDQLKKEDGAAIAVDLSECGSRGIVEALPSPNAAVVEPHTQFMLSRGQHDCHKKKLEEPGLVLDPSVKIELGNCG